MKFIILFIRFFLLFFQSEPELRGAVIQAAGLTCAMCSNAIYKSLLTLPFIDHVEPDLTNSSFIVRFKNNSDIQPDAIRRKIEDAGFSIAAFSWEVQFHQHDLKEKTIFTIRNMSFCLPENNKADGLKRLIMTDKNFTTERKLKMYDRQWKSKSCERTAAQKAYHVILSD